MMTIKRTDDWRGAGFALLAATLLLWPATALALPNCTTAVATLCANGGSTTLDCDGDGFTNAQECSSGITTDATDPTKAKTIAGCNSTTCGADVLDPTKADLFYLVSALKQASVLGVKDEYIDLKDTDQATGKVSLLFKALAKDSNALKVYTNGLTVRTHRLLEDNCGYDRLVKGNGAFDTYDTQWQKGIRAARIIENFSTTKEIGYIGSTPQSKPGDMAVASTIYTQRIKDNVDTNCSNYTNGSCKVINGKVTVATNAAGNNDDIVTYYIQQVVSHEMGHGSRLASTSASSYYHYTSSSTVMDPAATFSRGVYKIPTAYDLAKDKVALTLQEP